MEEILPDYSQREIDQGVDYYRLRLRNFIPVRGRQEYLSRTRGAMKDDPKNANKIFRRMLLLANYDVVSGSVVGIASFEGIKFGLQSLENLLK